jgi:hypothetical protein
MNRETAAIFIVVAAMTAQPVLSQTGQTSQLQMAPLNAKLAPGQKFDEAKTWQLIIGAQPSNAIRWIQIPQWLAGKWESPGDEVSNIVDDVTGTATQTRKYTPGLKTAKWGCIRDIEGNVWENFKAPYLAQEGDSRSFVYEYEITSTNSNAMKVRRRTVYLELTRSNKIKNVSHFLDIIHFVPVAEGLHSQTRRHAFDLQGKPVVSVTLDRTYHLIGPFAEAGTEVKEAFRKYQESMGQQYEP